jgi:hypothetical protein
MSKLTAQYNEYGYVIFKSGRPIYAAGNSPYESQTYVGSSLIYNGTVASKGMIPENTSVLDVNAIAKHCTTTIYEMYDHPELWAGKGLKKGAEYELGSIKFSRDLNPLEQAYKCGALAK